MARHKLAYLLLAETDILGIVQFHASQVGPSSAREIYRSIREQIGWLQDFPLLGPLVFVKKKVKQKGSKKVSTFSTYKQ